jgi:hypothetical protein
MTDPTAPVTPRTGRQAIGMIACSFCGIDIFPEQEERHMALSHRKRIEREAGSTDALRAALEGLRDHGYQPMYNGRPSCPFCANFVDDEETHRPGCILVAALAASDAGPAGIDVERLGEAGANVLDGRRIGSVRLYRNTITPDDWEYIAAEYDRLSRESDR